MSKSVPDPNTIFDQGPGKPAIRPGRFIYGDDELEGLTVTDEHGNEVPMSEYGEDDEPTKANTPAAGWL